MGGAGGSGGWGRAPGRGLRGGGWRKAARGKLVERRRRHALRKRLQRHRQLQHLLLQRLGVNIHCHPLSVALSRKMTLTQTKSRERGWMAV